MKNKKKKLKYIQKLNAIINSKYIDIFNNILISHLELNEENENIIESLLCSIFIKEVISEKLEDNFINIKNLLNNLYNIENGNKINEEWCKCIEEKYKISSEIYFPYINNMSFLYLFIRNDFENIKEQKKGFLIDDIYLDKNNEIIDNLYSNLLKVFNNEVQKKDLNILILEIGNILSDCLITKEPINNLENLCNNIKDYIMSENNINDEKTIFKKNILNNYLKLKNIYLNYKNEETMKFDDIENGNNEIMFSNKCPSLINYLNNNDCIYQKMKNEPIIFNTNWTSNSIPLWLICLRSLANYKNIIVNFGETDKIILNFEKEFKKEILNKIEKSNYKFQNNDWILLLSPNTSNSNKFIKNENYENIYKLFISLLKKVISLNDNIKSEILDNVKKFIFYIFDKAYEKYCDKTLIEDNEFEFIKNILNKINEIPKRIISEIFKDNNVIEIKSKLSLLLNSNSLEKKINNFKQFYCKISKIKEIESNYIIMEKDCFEYNNLVDKYNDNIKEEFNQKQMIINSYINKGDVYYKLSILDIFFNKKVDYLKKDKYIDKYINIIKNKNIEIIFDNFNEKDFLNEFHNLMLNIEKMLKIICTFNEMNFENKIVELKNLINEFIKPKLKIFNMQKHNLDKNILEEIYKDNNNNIDNELNNIKEKLNKNILLFENYFYNNIYFNINIIKDIYNLISNYMKNSEESNKNNYPIKKDNQNLNNKEICLNNDKNNKENEIKEIEITKNIANFNENNNKDNEMDMKESKTQISSFDKNYDTDNTNKLLKEEEKKEKIKPQYKLKEILDNLEQLKNSKVNLNKQIYYDESKINNNRNNENNLGGNNMNYNNQNNAIQIKEYDTKIFNYKNEKSKDLFDNENIQVEEIEIEENIEKDSNNIKSFKENENELNNKIIDKIILSIREKMGIEDKNYNFNIEPYIKPTNYTKKAKNKNEKFITQDLIDNSENYIHKVFENISKSNINYHITAFCFIIDCSSFIGLNTKLFNLMIVLSIIKVIEIIDIKYSILLSADDKFKVVIKNYNENVNFEDLIERIYEACVIERYKNNVTKAIKTAIDQLQCKDRKNTIFFIFCDCIDESIIYYKYWIDNILINKNNTFIIFAEKTISFKNEYNELINNIWYNFENKIKEKETNSKIKIIDINVVGEGYIINTNIFKNIFDFLNDIPNLLINDENIERKVLNSNQINKSNNIKMKNIKYFEELLKDETYKKYDNIFFSYQKIPNNNLNIENVYKNNEISSIFKYEKKNIPEIHSYTTKLQKLYQDKTLIESIFDPNKSTKKQLSTKGTEIDIMALILYTLHPLSEPKIYLEKKDGLIRDYSISIIIDNSKSCFSTFNEKHSFLTIINLLHIIYSLNIPSLDLIITNTQNENPHILIFDKPSITLFKDDVLFEKILKLISNPISNTDLSKAIKNVYDLRKMKKNDRDSYLFVLTDGLSHKSYENRIYYFSKLCQNIGIKIYGIGLGIYPYKAKQLFETFIYSENPEYLLKAISTIFGKINKTESELNLISKPYKVKNINEIFSQIIKNTNFYYEDLIKELKMIKEGEDVVNLFKKPEKERIKVREIKKQEILKRQYNIRNERFKNNKNKNKLRTILEDMCMMGNIMKEEILEKRKTNPEYFIPISEAIKDEKKDIFCLGVLAKALEEIGITTAIVKEDINKEDNKELSNTVLQFLMNGLLNKKKYSLHFDFGEKRNNELLDNLIEQEKFNNELKSKISKECNIPENEIILTSPQKGSYKIQLIFENEDFYSKNIEEFEKTYLDIKSDNYNQNKISLYGIKKICKDVLFEGCKLNKSMLDIRGNRSYGWAHNEKRGGLLYIPPEGWIGYGLNVWEKYDKGNNDWIAMDGNKNEWAVAYHGIKEIEVANLICSGGFKAGYRQAFEDSYNINSKNKKEKVGRGVYCSPSPEVLEEYALEINIEQKGVYKIGFMIRVRPDKIRIPHDMQNYWVLGNTNKKDNFEEMRPYRILIKKIQ